MKINVLRVSLMLLMLLIIFLGATYVKYIYDLKKHIVLDLDYTESADTLKNPERGWYLISSCMVNDNYEEGNNYYYDFAKQYNEGDTLTLILFNLANYRNQDISAEGLHYIINVFQGVREAGMKAIVRFEYDWDGKGEEHEPEDISTILKHMEQVSSLVNENKDVIYLLQGIFVGSYGEMHGSRYLKEDDVSTLLQKLLKHIDADIPLAVRTPAYWRMFNQSDLPVSKFTEQPGARIGFYNDALCSSEIDIGTYSDGTDTDDGYADKWDRQKELAFQSELCQIVPNGGETAMVCEVNDLDNILKEFPMIHISYLNRGYNTEVLNKWKETSYHAVSQEDPYQEADGYQYVSDHLGYRFVLREVIVPDKIYRSNKSVIKLKIENTGFANLYQDKNISIIYKSQKTGDEITVPLDVDTRLWKAGAISELKVRLPAKLLKQDTYQLYLKISDPYGKVIQMANHNIFDVGTKANTVGSIQVIDISFQNIWNKR